jgi:tRNA pseudouridine(38-40) synthase
LLRTLKLTISYDGYDYHGWQVQPGAATIQGALVDAIEAVTGKRLLPQGSGRTDAGVHALAQVASFQTESRIPLENFRIVLNDRLKRRQPAFMPGTPHAGRATSIASTAEIFVRRSSSAM